MRLTAIYIKQHYLFSPSQIINLGGKYFYEITERREENEYDLKRYENPNFINNFWGDDISLVSAVVGENGSGKTSLLKQVTTYGNWYPFNFFIWEDNDALFFTKIYHASFSRIKPKIFFNGKELLNKSEISESTQSIYYSPVLSYEYDGYRDSSYRTKFYNTSRATVYLTLNTLLGNNNLNLSNFISENLIRELIFCENFKNFSAKYSFLDYNVAFSTIKDKLDNLRHINEKIGLSEDELKYNKDFQDIESKFKIIPYTYNSLPYQFYIEFILYLKYYFEEQINSILRTELLDENLDKVIKFFFETPKRFREKNIRERFENIKKLYYLIVKQTSYDLFNYTFSRKDAIDIIDLQEKIAFSVESKDNLISGAKFFTPNPTNVLSSGEKSLLNLFSNIYSTFSNSYVRYADEKMDVNNQFTNYNQKIERIILFLDEADLGFHPQWKKKYIKSLFKKVIIKKSKG